MALSRQKLPTPDPERYPVREGVANGAYVLSEARGEKAAVILIATGSEVHLALAAQTELLQKGVPARVVSMPSWELFDGQTADYRARVLPAEIPKLAIEAGVTRGWRDYVGPGGDIIGLDRFGASAPGTVVMEKLGFNVENVVSRAMKIARELRELAA
ncbi:MAG TPA: transketolase C-terminal domain-containing protein [Candidatus Sulfotelmatobacter sp.]|nr:transketolase C-terminal domain-containing protein [Candidatus Sulfotelmatobacter sp.]